MKSAWDVSDDVEREIESTRPLLTDDYTSDDVNDLKRTIEEGNPERDLDEDAL